MKGNTSHRWTVEKQWTQITLDKIQERTLQDKNGVILEKVAERGCGILTWGAIPDCPGKFLNSLKFLSSCPKIIDNKNVSIFS